MTYFCGICQMTTLVYNPDSHPSPSPFWLNGRMKNENLVLNITYTRCRGCAVHPPSPPHFEFSEHERVGYFQLKASPPQSRDAAAFRQTSMERRESLRGDVCRISTYIKGTSRIAAAFRILRTWTCRLFPVKSVSQSVSQSVIDHCVYYVNILHTNLAKNYTKEVCFLKYHNIAYIIYIYIYVYILYNT